MCAKFFSQNVLHGNQFGSFRLKTAPNYTICRLSGFFFKTFTLFAIHIYQYEIEVMRTSVVDIGLNTVSC